MALLPDNLLSSFLLNLKIRSSILISLHLCFKIVLEIFPRLVVIFQWL
jgi:hypothetical protein